MSVMHHRTAAERLERDRARIAHAREQLARLDELTVKAQAAAEKGDEILGTVDQGLEKAQDAAVTARSVAPRVIFVTLGVIAVVGVVIVLRKRSAAKDDLDD